MAHPTLIAASRLAEAILNGTAEVCYNGTAVIILGTDNDGIPFSFCCAEDGVITIENADTSWDN